ncbi:MAG: FimV/HubP family polar landmark protein [Gammaproteobacteria bacterium]
MSKKLTFVLAFMLAVLPVVAQALGLGEIKLNSALNQPFSADIPIVGAAPDEISSLHLKTASAAQFQQAGIPMSKVLSQLQFQVVQDPNGTAHVHISSSKPFNEPFMDVLVDATWDNGELLREYTVFLNPPSFENATQPAAAPAAPATSTPVATPTSPVPAPPPAISAPVQAVQPPAATPAVSPAVSAGNTPLGGNYGPIHRGETLSEIALRLHPQGVTLNQMMIAIYRANPEVFMHNINLMKAGYVMRIPTADDIQAVQVAQANSEVRTQIAEWRSHRGLATTHKTTSTTTTEEQPSLQLVAPSSAAQTNENQVPGAGAGGTVVATNAAGAASQTVATAAGATSNAAATIAAGASTASHAPIAVASNSLAAVQGQASKQNKQPAETKITPLAPEKPIVTKPLSTRKTKVIAPVQPAQSGSLLGSLLNPYVIVLIIIVILLIIIGIVVRNRRASSPVSSKPIRSKMEMPSVDTFDGETEEKDHLKDVTVAPTAGMRGKSTQAGRMAAGAAAGAAALAATATSKPDETDPVAEADFHMAYGLYDQAADVLKKALLQEPGRRDLKKKLLEVYFTAGDRANFVETARELRQEMGAQPDKDWENIAIMGRQVAADDPLFSGNGSATGTASRVDIPLDSGGTGTAVHTDLDPLAGAFDGIRSVTLPETPAPAAPAGNAAVDFSLPEIEPTPAKRRTDVKAAGAGQDTSGLTVEPQSDARKKAAKVGVSTVTADFGTDSQVEFDKALKELSDFVNTNVPPQEEGTRSGAGTGAALSLAADAGEAGVTTGTGTSTGEETTGLNEIGTKLDLARAYIDMGDSDGAKNILQEVLAEGDTQQKQEAQKLMQHLA